MLDFTMAGPGLSRHREFDISGKRDSGLTGLDLSLSSALSWQICAIAMAAGVAHGISGFGFPLISTPVVALFTDVRTAVVMTLLPNIAVNLISLSKGGNWRESLGKYWPVAVYVMLGTLVGTRLILITPPEPLKLLLAVIIVVYLKQDSFKQVDWGVINRHPKLAGMAFGLLGGVLSGAVNVALPPLIIYFSILGLAPLAMTQILNLCFLAGRTTQIAALGGVGQLGADVLVIAIPAVAAAIAGVLAGGYFQSRIPPASWRAIIRAVLWVLAMLLFGQVFLPLTH
jgi:uncharacterized membrane protein YfcA